MPCQRRRREAGSQQSRPAVFGGRARTDQAEPAPKYLQEARQLDQPRQHTLPTGAEFVPARSATIDRDRPPTHTEGNASGRE